MPRRTQKRQPGVPGPRSASCERVDLRSPGRRLVRGPALTAVLAAVDLTAIGGAGHQPRPVLVEGEGEHGVRRLDAHVDLGPSVAAVAAGQQDASVALEIAARRDKYFARITRDLANVAAVDLALFIHRFQRDVAPVVAPVIAAEHSGAADAEHGTGPPAAGQDGVHIDRVVVEILAVAEVFPVLAAVGGAEGPANFDGGVQVVWFAHARVHFQHALRRVGARRRGDVGKAHADGQAEPALAGIVAAVDLAVLIAGEDDVGIVGVEQERPYWEAVVLDVDLLPMLAVVVAAIGARLGAGEDDFRVQRVHGEGAHGGCVWKATGQRLPFVCAVGQAIQAGLHNPTAAGFSGEAQVDVGMLGVCSAGWHGVVLPL